MYDKFIQNDNKRIKQTLNKIICIYSRRIKLKKIKYINKWRLLLFQKTRRKKKNNFIIMNSTPVFKRLYDNYKYKKSHLEALKLCYIIKESEENSFQPQINRNFLPYNYDSNFLQMQNLRRFQRKQKNLSLNDMKKNYNSQRNNNYFNNKNNQYSKFNLRLYNNSKNDYYNSGRNFFSGLSTNPHSIREKILFDYDNNKKPEKNMFSKNYNSISLFDSNDELSPKQNNNNIYSLSTNKKKYPIMFSEVIQNKKKNLFNNINNNPINYDIKKGDLNDNSNSQILENLNNEKKQSYSVDLKNNENEKKENKKNINELSTSNEQFTVKALYPQSSHVTLQSISDNIFMQLAEKYVDSDSLLK